jgi:glycosyltransferase involved in cell wall biosynthesis
MTAVDEIIVDSSFENLQTGIGQDSNFILSLLSENNKVVKLYPGPKILPVRIRRKYLSIIYFLFKREYSLNLKKDCIFYQAQVSTVIPGASWKNWTIRIHDIFPITNPEWFRRIAYLNFHRQMKKIENLKVIVLTSSIYTKTELLRCLPGLEGRIEVIPCQVRKFSSKKCHTCQACSILAKRLLTIDYLLAVGTIEPRKNYLFAYEFFMKNKAEVKCPQLVIVGKSGWKTKMLRIRLRSADKNKLIWLKSCCDASLVDLYKHSRAYVSFSLDEGFNLPAMEARELFQKPLILTDIPVHREMHESNAYFYKNSRDLQGILSSKLEPSEIPTTMSKDLAKEVLSKILI